MNNEKIKKQDDSVIKLLELKVIRRLICNTDRGPLDLVIRKGESNYFLMLDSTPLNKETNDKLMGILFATPIPEVKKGMVSVPISITPEHAEQIFKDYNKGKPNVDIVVSPKKKAKAK